MTALLAAGSLIGGIGDLVGGLLGGGADPEKLADRASRVATLYNLASSGNFDAWLYLAAIGQIQKTPKQIAIPGLATVPAGWDSKPWGDVYDKIVSKARSLANELQPQFAQMGFGVTLTGGVNPVLISGPGAPGQSMTPAKPGGFQTFLDSVPWYGWAALVLVLLLVFMRL